MTKSDASFLVLIDYDNLTEPQKTKGILSLVASVLARIPMEDEWERALCDVRLYGGWYEGVLLTKSAQNVVIEIQSEFPAVIRIPRSDAGTITVRLNADLARALMQEPTFHLLNTYRRKGRPYNVRVETPASAGCADSACWLLDAKKLLKTGSCHKQGCGIQPGNLIYRDEQKIVDTMLACDLIYASESGFDRIVLISGDDDFLPPLRTALLKGAHASRVRPKPNCPTTHFPPGGISLLEMDL